MTTPRSALTTASLSGLAIGVAVAIGVIGLVIVTQLTGPHATAAAVTIAVLFAEMLGAGLVALSAVRSGANDRVLRTLDLGRWIVIGAGALGALITIGVATVLGEGIALAVIIGTVTFTAQRLVRQVRTSLTPSPKLST